MLYAFLFSPILATCPTHPILCDLITGIIFGEVYRSSVQLVGIRVPILVRGGGGEGGGWFSSECSKNDVQYCTFGRFVGSPAVMPVTVM
jgi:hypothetical protein